jgi:hypothetical protein
MTLNEDQEELRAHFGTKIPAWHQQKVAKLPQKRRAEYRLPGKSVQGDALEFSTSSFLGMRDISQVNSNEYFMNSPGIDHLQDDPRFLFVQDKLHLSPHTATIQSYRDHYKNRWGMAQKLVKALGETTTKRGSDLFRMLGDALAKDTWVNKHVLQTIVTRIHQHIQDVNEFEAALERDEDPDEVSPLTEDDALIATIANALAFSVPRDMWELLYQAFAAGQIPQQEMHAYIRLDLSTGEFTQVLKLFDTYVAPANEKKRKSEDSDYELDE